MGSYQPTIKCPRKEGLGSGSRSVVSKLVCSASGNTGGREVSYHKSIRADATKSTGHIRSSL